MTRIDWGDYRDYLRRGLHADRVLLPVYYDPVAEDEAAWNGIPLNTRVPMPPPAPTIPPGTVSVPAEAMRRYDGRPARPVVHALRLDADQWARLLRSTLGHLAQREYATGLAPMTVTDLHTGVAWAVRIDPDQGDWDRYGFTGFPVSPYTVKLPIDPARTRDAIAMTHDRFVRPLGRLAGVR